MPPEAVLATVTLPQTTMLPEDDVVNDFTITCPGGLGSVDEDDLRDAIVDFYNADPGGIHGPIASFLGNQLSRTADVCTIRFYNLDGHLDGSPHGSPFFQDMFTLGAATAGDSFPSEVAVCVTLRGQGADDALVTAPDGSDPDAKPDRPKQRRTGRLYLGPLQDACADNLDSDPTVNTAFSDAIADAFENYFAAVSAIDVNFAPCVWSRKNGNLYVLDYIYVDSAFDTQRRRGRKATSRMVHQLP